MEQRAYQKWTRGLLLGLVLVLTACAAVGIQGGPLLLLPDAHGPGACLLQ